MSKAESAPIRIETSLHGGREPCRQLARVRKMIGSKDQGITT
jgi:hypothetical protein